MHQGLFPFDTETYTRLDDIEGKWTQVDRDVFPQKTPWSEPAKVTVLGDKVTFAVTPWTRNSETIKDNKRELLGYFFDVRKKGSGRYKLLFTTKPTNQTDQSLQRRHLS